jgi:signal transduction histidine kinase
VGGAIAMGCGIWSMHFIAMLALQLSVPIRYDVALTALSLVVAIVAAGLALLPKTVSQTVTVTLRLADGVPNVMVDPVQLDQVLLNLVINARDAMPHGGNLIIETATENGQVVLTVADTGTGMDAETRGRIFDPFFTTKGLAGTGLGLPTVYGIVKQSGGSVTCDSVPGVGSTFRVFLPAVDPVAAHDVMHDAESAARATV